MVACLAGPPGTVISHLTAAAAYGLAKAPEEPQRLAVEDPAQSARCAASSCSRAGSSKRPRPLGGPLAGHAGPGSGGCSRRWRCGDRARSGKPAGSEVAAAAEEVGIPAGPSTGQGVRQGRASFRPGRPRHRRVESAVGVRQRRAPRAPMLDRRRRTGRPCRRGDRMADGLRRSVRPSTFQQQPPEPARKAAHQRAGRTQAFPADGQATPRPPPQHP